MVLRPDAVVATGNGFEPRSGDISVAQRVGPVAQRRFDWHHDYTPAQRAR
jgi:hypothetical protein